MSAEPSPLNQERIKRAERDFHDDLYGHAPVEYFPPTPGEFMEWFRRLHLTPFYAGGWSYWGDARQEAFNLLGDLRDKRVLDFGCGLGHTGIYMALEGADVWGFDLAQFGVKRAQDLAERYGLTERTHFECMDAEALTYPPDFFDVILGIGVLHHVIKYPRAAEHTARILKPGGRAYFVETLWDNPLINLARRFSSLEKAAGDVALTHGEINNFARPFTQVALRKLHLLYMLKRLAKLPATMNLTVTAQPRPLWRAIYKLDQVMLKLPPLRFLCGEVIVELRK